MPSVSNEPGLPARGETLRVLLLRLWDEVEQTLAGSAPEPRGPARQHAGAVSSERQPSEGATPTRVRYAFD